MSDHLSPDVLARYLMRTGMTAELYNVENHLLRCPICMEEITVRDLVNAAKEVREKLVSAVRAGEGSKNCAPVS